MFTLIDVGTVITGGVVSATVTVKVFGADVLPATSVAVQVTTLAPSGKLAPDAGLQLGVTPSVAVAV